MTEDEFDSLLPGRSFQPDDVAELEAKAGRRTIIGLSLWGRTPADLERQMEAPHPEIPPGCSVADLQDLQNYLGRLATAIGNPRNSWLAPLTLSSLSLIAGSHRMTGLEARLEIVRRAIEYLKKQ